LLLTEQQNRRILRQTPPNAVRSLEFTALLIISKPPWHANHRWVLIEAPSWFFFSQVIIIEDLPLSAM